MAQDTTGRCAWAKDPLEVAYHDTEWGVPQHDDRKLFEMLILEGMQAGLTWRLILHRRENMRHAFDGFDPAVISGYDDAKKAALLQDAGIIRNRLKINALVANAKAFLQVQQEFGSFDTYIWGFVGGKQVRTPLQNIEDMPATSSLSDTVSKDLKKRGFKFVGSTICYSYLQAIGILNDHMANCPFAHEA